MENIKKEFVLYELALKMKALEFVEPCFAKYNYFGEIDFKANSYEPRWFINDFLQSMTIDEYFEQTQSTVILAPTWQSAFMFFIEKYNMYASINIYRNKWMCRIISTVENEEYSSGYIIDSINKGYPTFNTFEEARKASLEKLLEIVEKQKEK